MTQCKYCNELLGESPWHENGDTDDECLGRQRGKVLRELVEWWDREGKEETSATYSLAWIHGYRTIHKPGDKMLEQIVEEARALKG